MERIIDSFCEGDVERLLATCRKPCNSCYSAEELEQMTRDLDSNGRTLNLPYCFCRGARDLYAAAVDAFGDLSNDIEVRDQVELSMFASLWPNFIFAVRAASAFSPAIDLIAHH